MCIEAFQTILSGASLVIGNQWKPVFCIPLYTGARGHTYEGDTGNWLLSVTGYNLQNGLSA